MLNSASKLFFNLLRRLRGVEKVANSSGSPRVRDALYPLRQLATKNMAEQRARLKKVAKQDAVKDSKPSNTSAEKRMLNPVISITSLHPACPKSAIFEDEFMARIIASQSVSYTPEWFQYAARRSTTDCNPSADESFEKRLAEYGEENEENEDDLFTKMVTPENRVKNNKLFKKSDSPAPLQLRSPGLTSPKQQCPDILTHTEIGGVTPEAIRIHLEETWASTFSKASSREISQGGNNLSLARARDASFGGNNLSLARARDPSLGGNNLSLARARNLSNWNNLSLARARNHSNWKSLSAARARGFSSSVQSMHRENSLSVSIAMVSFQYALRRSTVQAPTTDEVFEQKLKEFAEEEERLQEEQWLALQKLTPNVSAYKNSL